MIDKIPESIIKYLEREDIVDAINLNDMAKVYLFSDTYFGGSEAKTITEIFISAGINPLNSNLVNIPEGFAENISMKNVIIKEGVRSIGKHAFKGNADLENITIPANLKSISVGAFDNCFKDKTVNIIGDLNAYALIVGLDRLNQGDVHLTEEGAEIENLVLDKVKRISDQAFYNQHLKSLTLGKSCEYIGWNAFSKNPELEEFKYSGTLEEFKKVEFRPNTFSGTKISKVICSDGEGNLKEYVTR